jgi:hypothetical protein
MAIPERLSGAMNTLYKALNIPLIIKLTGPEHRLLHEISQCFDIDKTVSVISKIDITKSTGEAIYITLLIKKM